MAYEPRWQGGRERTGRYDEDRDDYGDLSDAERERQRALTRSYGGHSSGFRSSSNYRDASYRDPRDADRDEARRIYGKSPEERGFFERAGDEVASWFGSEDAARRREFDERYAGIHRGRGPRNYIRTDERICEEVNDRLTEDPYVDASDIVVTVRSGEVILDGMVENRFAKRRAEDTAEGVSGVQHVQNNLRYRQPTSTGAAAMAGLSGEKETSTQNVASPLNPRVTEPRNR